MKYIYLLLAYILSSITLTGKEYTFVFVGEEGNHTFTSAIDIYDGDTFKFQFPDYYNALVPSVIAGKFSIRIRNLDTPEKRKYRGSHHLEKPAGYLVGQYLESIFEDAERIIITNAIKGKYGGRIVADVILDDVLNVGNHLIEKDLAKTYDGGKKLKWTERDLQHILNELNHLVD